MIPTQEQIEIPLLETLVKLGGQAKPKAIYPYMTERFPQLTEEDLAARLKHGETKWHNRIQWTRQALITTGDMAKPERGIWAITEQGRKRLEANGRHETEATKHTLTASVSLVDLYEKYDLQFRSKLLDRLPIDRLTVSSPSKRLSSATLISAVVESNESPSPIANVRVVVL